MKDAQQVARELGAEIESLQGELRAASTDFHLFNALRDSVEFQSELEKSPLFWSFTRHAHLQAAVISIVLKRVPSIYSRWFPGTKKARREAEAARLAVI